MRQVCLFLICLTAWVQSYAACDSPAIFTIKTIMQQPLIMTISWSPVSGAIEYEYSMAVLNHPHPLKETITGTSRNIQGLIYDTVYVACVRTRCDSVTYSPWICVYDTVHSTTGIINTLSGNDLLRAYPNPATNMLTLEYGNLDKNISVTITDVMGKVVYNALMTSSKQTIDISQWPSGIYTVKCLGDNNSYMTKVVKE